MNSLRTARLRPRPARLIIGMTLLLAGLLLPIRSQGHAANAQASGEGRLYPETGYILAPEFISFYDKGGGVPLLGYPISEAHIEDGAEGKSYLVQWTERQRLEYHPTDQEAESSMHNAGLSPAAYCLLPSARCTVLLGLLGRELTDGLDGPRFQADRTGQQTADGRRQTASPTFFPETGQDVGDLFFNYWQAQGGLSVFGYPISNQYSDNGLQVQWFERARFEEHPADAEAESSMHNAGLSPAAYCLLPSARCTVLLGLLGYETLKERALVSYKFEVYPNPAPETNMEIGLAQGGESADPGFFDNIREQGSRLGPALVRVDNVFNYYNIVQRGPEGLITYNWRQFDSVLDSLRAMNKEPLICLSYMPETMSATGNSRIVPPANYDEWAALIRATVTHVNIERKMGVRYWEVWNEPDQWSFWQGSYPEYLRLYDTTAEAALSADPTIKIGGPGISRFSIDHLDEFLQHEVSLGDKGRVDFISWHSYGQSGAEIASNIRRVRELMAQYPPFNPQIFITEFSVLQGGAGDTSANGYTDTVEGAIAFLSSIESMQRERVDRALLFELKDGRGPRSYWGKWGVLTYDGKPKPIYYALKAYETRPQGMLPVQLVKVDDGKGPTDGALGFMAYGSPSKSTLMLWYTGRQGARVKVALPNSFADTTFDLTLFDHDTNNPAKTGDPTLTQMLSRNAGDLLLDLKPNSLALITSR